MKSGSWSSFQSALPPEARTGGEPDEPEPLDNHDCDGRSIPSNEQPDTVIRVWQVSPHPFDRHYDHWIGRDYHRACEAAKAALENGMDQMDESSGPVTVSAKIIEMSVKEYWELAYMEGR